MFHLHAFTGCDTTSAIFRQGKHKLFKLLQKDESLKVAAQIFKEPNASSEAVASTGEKLFLSLYGDQGDVSSNQFRCQCFTQAISKNAPNLASLPPSSDLACLHSFRVYLQMQMWYMVTKYLYYSKGWRHCKTGLFPIPMQKDPAPQELLKLISCKCVKGCQNSCSCRKTGLHCSLLCKNCEGRSCSNVADIIEDEDSMDEEEK